MSTELQAQSNTAVAVSFFDVQGFELMQRIAKAFSSSELVPKAYQNSLPSCLIAVEMAARMNASPLMIMQNLYVVHGNPGWSSKFLVATINTCGRYSTLRYEVSSDNAKDKNYKCRAWAIEKSTGERLDGEWIDWEMVNSEGWATKSGSKWKTMPGQMFKYRASAFWCRAYAPELSMGLQTTEELHDTIDFVKGDDDVYIANIDPLVAAANASKQKDEKKESVDTETGVITEKLPTDTELIYTYAEIREAIESSKTQEEAHSAREMIKHVKGEKFQEELNAIALEKMMEFQQ